MRSSFDSFALESDAFGDFLRKTYNLQRVLGMRASGGSENLSVTSTLRRKRDW